MKVLDEVVTKAKAVVGDKLPSGGVVDLLFDYFKRPENKGVEGLVKKFETAGLGPLIKSWMGEEKKLPITPEQVTKVFGNDEVNQMAGKLNLPVEETTKNIAQFLPDVVQKLTPGGKIPAFEKIAELAGSK